MSLFVVKEITKIIKDAEEKNINLMTDKPNTSQKFGTSKHVPIRPYPSIRPTSPSDMQIAMDVSAISRATNNVNVCILPSITPKTVLQLPVTLIEEPTIVNSNLQHVLIPVNSMPDLPSR